MQAQYSISPSLGDLVELGAQIVEGAWDLGTSLIGDIVELFGSVTVPLDFSTIAHDSAFQDPAWNGGHSNAVHRRGWGPNHGAEIAPHGTEVEILRWSRVIIPTRHAGAIGRNGRVNIEVAKGGAARQGGMCVKLANRAAMITHALTEAEYCDFGQYIPPGQIEQRMDPLAGITGDFGNLDLVSRYSSDNPVRVALHEHHFGWLAQITDANDYVRAVVGHSPRQASINTGWIADLLTVEGRAFVPCLDFPEMENSAVAIIEVAAVAAGTAQAQAGVGPGSVVGALGAVASPFLARDIFLPYDGGNAQSTRNSRGVSVHEYGHFVMCDLFSREGLEVLPSLYIKRSVDEGALDEPDAETGVMMESFAAPPARVVAYFTGSTSQKMLFVVSRGLRGVYSTYALRARRQQKSAVVHGVGDQIGRPRQSHPGLGHTGTSAADGCGCVGRQPRTHEAHTKHEARTKDARSAKGVNREWHMRHLSPPPPLAIHARLCLPSPLPIMSSFASVPVCVRWWGSRSAGPFAGLFRVLRE